MQVHTVYQLICFWDVTQKIGPDELLHPVVLHLGLHSFPLSHSMFGLILYIPVNNFSVMSVQVILG